MLAGPRGTERKFSPYDMVHEYPIADGVRIYHGGLVGLNAVGHIVPAQSATILVLGRARCPDGRSMLGNGVLKGYAEQGIFSWKQQGTTITRAHIGSFIYAIDDETVNLAGAMPAGAVYDIKEDSPSEVWVMTYLVLGLVSP